MTQKIIDTLIKIKDERPFILNIANYYPMDLVASGIRSISAFPIMSNAEQEMEELLGLCRTVVIYLGKLDDEFIKVSNRICKLANKRNIPVILDSVGAGASRYRTDSAINIVKNNQISIIRAYPNEVAGLLTGQLVIQDMSLLEHSVTIENAKLLSQKYDVTVVASGRRHIAIDHEKITQFNFDSQLLQKVAGIGSLLSAIIGVFHAIEPNRFIATTNAVDFYGNCVGPVSCTSSGPASLLTQLIDKLYKSSADAKAF